MLLFIFAYAIRVLTEAVGKTIKDLRMQKRISQEKLADAIDSHQVYISEIERGLKMPSLSILYEIAKFFGISLTELVSIIESNIKGSSE
ncbi:MAG: helix-turn-helix transcriptional regulator [Spirochaetales bacterium]|nr:helix-turn-helix transcriptional regulator [Spirochaetales bacterium]